MFSSKISHRFFFFWKIIYKAIDSAEKLNRIDSKPELDKNQQKYQIQ